MVPWKYWVGVTVQVTLFSTSKSPSVSAAGRAVELNTLFEELFRENANWGIAPAEKKWSLFEPS